MKRTEHQFSEITRLHSSICSLYRIKEALLWVVLVGLVAWTTLYIVDYEKGKAFMPVMVVNLLIVGVVIVLDTRYRGLLKKLHNLIDKE